VDEIRLVDLTSFGTGHSDVDGNIVFHEEGKILAYRISGLCLCMRRIPFGEYNAIINKKDMSAVPAFSGHLGKLKASGGSGRFIGSEYE
jgi:hypothetical protein